MKLKTASWMVNFYLMVRNISRLTEHIRFLDIRVTMSPNFVVQKKSKEKESGSRGLSKSVLWKSIKKEKRHRQKPETLWLLSLLERITSRISEILKNQQPPQKTVYLGKKIFLKRRNPQYH